MPIDWDSEFEAAAAECAASYTPESRERAARKSAAEFERGVALGFHDADGNALTPESDETDDDDDE